MFTSGSRAADADNQAAAEVARPQISASIASSLQIEATSDGWSEAVDKRYPAQRVESAAAASRLVLVTHVVGQPGL